MGSTQRQVPRQADISFMVVRNGGTYAPVLVRRESFIRKVGSAVARETYQTAYVPKDFPSPIFVSSGEAG
jgi:hypothetical protein